MKSRETTIRIQQLRSCSWLNNSLARGFREAWHPQFHLKSRTSNFTVVGFPESGVKSGYSMTQGLTITGLHSFAKANTLQGFSGILV